MSTRLRRELSNILSLFRRHEVTRQSVVITADDVDELSEIVNDLDRPRCANCAENQGCGMKRPGPFSDDDETDVARDCDYYRAKWEVPE
jgi:hypothetical protein